VSGLRSQLQTRKTLVGTNPAAGAEVTEAVPAGKDWLLVAVTLVLVQALVQTPQPILQVDDGTNVLFEGFGASAAQAVSTTCRYTWAPGLPLSAVVGAGANCHANAPLPEDLVLPAGGHVKTVTLGIGANSDYAAPVLYVVEVG
jgi:hypothetical protein